MAPREQGRSAGAARPKGTLGPYRRVEDALYAILIFTGVLVVTPVRLVVTVVRTVLRAVGWVAGLARMHRRAALLTTIGLAAIVGGALDLLASGARAWFSAHQFTTALLSEALLLAAAYVGFDHLAAKRERKRWHHAAASGIVPLYQAAYQVHSAVDRVARFDRASATMTDDEWSFVSARCREFTRVWSQHRDLFAASSYLLEYLAAASSVSRIADAVASSAGPESLPFRAYLEQLEDALRVFERELTGLGPEAGLRRATPRTGVHHGLVRGRR